MNLQPVDFMKVGKIYHSDKKEKGKLMICLVQKGHKAEVLYSDGTRGWTLGHTHTEARAK